jgi:hypothetical protein
MPPPCPQDIVVTMFNHAMDDPGYHPAARVDDDNSLDHEKNIRVFHDVAFQLLLGCF